MKQKKGFFEGNFGKYLLPGVLLQSVLIGGGYATGRETVTYGGKFGAWGWLSGIGIMIGFAVVALLTFEIARLYHAYDYKSMIKVLIGPLWPLFDVAYVLMMTFFIAVMASASGSIVEETVGLNYWFGVALIVIITAMLMFFGDHFIEKFETWGTVILYVGYIVFTVMVIVSKGIHIPEVFASWDTSYVDSAPIGSVLWTGIIYVAYNLAIYPAAMFSLKRQESRKECVISGLLAGVIMTVPWFMTYFALLCFYPDASVFGANIPWLVMIGNIGAPRAFTVIFGIVMGWTLIETATGVIHALLGRVNAELVERKKKEMNRNQRAGITMGILILACLLSRFGIIDLIEKGYTFLSYAFMVLYLFPIITIGVFKILKKEPIRKKEKTMKIDVEEVAGAE